MTELTLDAVADELYGQSPEGFIARRDGKVKQARSAGDRELATAIKGLRRPTVSAWLVNLLTHQGSSALTELLQLGVDLRHAQSMLDAVSMKTLTARRQQLERDVVAQAAQLASEFGVQPVAPAAYAELEGTLRAAVADPAAAAAVASGRLTRALSYAGFGEVDLTAATATPIGAGTERRVADHDAQVIAFPSASRPTATPPEESGDAVTTKEHDAQAILSARQPVDEVVQHEAEGDAVFDELEAAEQAAAQAVVAAQRQLALATARRDLANAERDHRVAATRAAKAAKARDHAQRLVADLTRQLDAATDTLRAADEEAESAQLAVASATTAADAARKVIADLTGNG